MNDIKTLGHKSVVTQKKKNGVIGHVPTTHSSSTRGMKNIPLVENFDKNDTRQSFIVPKQQYTDINKIGKYYPDLYPRNSQDKAVIRHIKKQ